ncbi:uncharacterized protein LOC121994339 isoform X2 [Zingiber officinale]|uniref:uncharacterized protein LOC121994339 isoform X2 n=1 Tax=Zingiber officinale TaxID=94328 RepID=UPI001C4C9BFA|nr:uncharacterized protein LOC121994339 isoform X2 [Zingiber officinale]
MVGIFTIFSGYLPKPRHLQPLEEVTEKRRDHDGYADLEREEEEGIVVAVEQFKPINHPTEPSEDDRPMKHPLPFSSMVNEEGEMTKTFIENLRKMAESPKGNEGGICSKTSKLVDRKRQHYDQGHPLLPSSNYNFFQVFQQCKDFEA